MFVVRTRPPQKQDPPGPGATRLAIGLAIGVALAMALYVFFLIASGRLPEVVSRS